jgi:hypothetical protein
VRFEDSFEIWLTKDKRITLSEAIDIGKRELTAYLVYDPLGVYGPDSWYWCSAILEILVQDGFIKSFKILKESPVELKYKEGVVY